MQENMGSREKEGKSMTWGLGSAKTNKHRSGGNSAWGLEAHSENVPEKRRECFFGRKTGILGVTAQDRWILHFTNCWELRFSGVSIRTSQKKADGMFRWVHHKFKALQQ